MDQGHQEMHEDMDRKQAELLTIVHALKDSWDGVHLHSKSRDTASGFSSKDPHHSSGQGILGPNPFQAPTVRHHNLMFPRFNGENLKTWLYRIEYFSVDDNPRNHRLKLVAMNLEDEALAWHQSYLKCRESNVMPNWEEYLGDLIEVFGCEFGDPMLELKQLRQTGTVQEFQFAFDRLLAQCNLTTKQAMLCFFGGFEGVSESHYDA